MDETLPMSSGSRTTEERAFTLQERPALQRLRRVGTAGKSTLSRGLGPRPAPLGDHVATLKNHPPTPDRLAQRRDTTGTGRLRSSRVPSPTWPA